MNLEKVQNIKWGPLKKERCVRGISEGIVSQCGGILVRSPHFEKQDLPLPHLAPILVRFRSIRVACKYMHLYLLFHVCSNLDE